MPEANSRKEIMIEARIKGPGPARYLLPSTLGRTNVDSTRKYAPSFSFGQKTWKMASDSPGPVYNFNSKLTNRGSADAPQFSFSSRNKEAKIYVTPGPGTYNAEKVVPPLEKKAPAFTLGMRTRYRPKDCAPPPNRYSLPCTLGNKVPHMSGAVAVSFSGRHDIFSSNYDFARTPGPAGYSATDPAVIKEQSPAYSLQPRTTLPKTKMNNPGPGAYDPVKQKRSNHKFSMGMRHSEFIMPMLSMADVEE